MTKNQHKFMLKTGKYLPDEDIQYNSRYYYFEKLDISGNQVYFEDSTGYFEHYETNENGDCTYFETSYGYWEKNEYDLNGNCTYFENSDGHWEKLHNGTITESGITNDK